MTKICVKCTVEKDAELDFYKRKNAKDDCWCKDCRRAYHREWIKNNKELQAYYKAKWLSIPENAAKTLETKRRYSMRRKPQDYAAKWLRRLEREALDPELREKRLARHREYLRRRREIDPEFYRKELERRKRLEAEDPQKKAKRNARDQTRYYKNKEQKNEQTGHTT